VGPPPPPPLLLLLLLLLLLEAENGDRDKGELIKNDLKMDDVEQNATKSGSGNSSGALIRVATVDNFQGEESKIIIASLVRSNKLGSIGPGASQCAVLKSERWLHPARNL
jgi:superfamily I DNA and/or RNA helicase